MIHWPTQVHIPRVRRFAYLVYRSNPSLFIRSLKLENILMGGAPYSGITHARLSGDLLAPSIPVADSPHAQFLRTHLEIGDSIFEPDRFTATEYCKYALKCIELYGRFFSHTDLQGILQRAKAFVGLYNGASYTLEDRHQSLPTAPVEVSRIRYSDCYQVIDGHHRLAVAAVRGLNEYPCAILPTDRVFTPMQLMVMDSVWLKGQLRVFQPIPTPELQRWAVARKCTDRLDLMTRWLSRNGISSGSFFDVGACYGWFVAEMTKLGFQASGVEQDAALATAGRLAYGLHSSAIVVANLGHYLRSNKQKYDIVCCLSVLQNYLLRNEGMAAEEFIQLVNQVTGSVLFFETGECHESRFKRALAGWNVEYIQNWLRRNTSFSKIELLGADGDQHGIFRVQFGRHLFACTR
jgi:2-polyprenyl-3-methyl-5-hydroxy-6-metoxy-1,4-benzoquinol methylase